MTTVSRSATRWAPRWRKADIEGRRGAIPAAYFTRGEKADGSKPVCFYHTCKGYRVESLFKPKKARERTAVPEVSAHDG